MVIIIGAGLSGLITGYILKKKGIPFKILETRSRVGGRINTIYQTNKAPVEMGATWFTTQHVHLITLLKELNISYFKQSMDSNVLYQPTSDSPVQIVQVPLQAPSYRISGGSSALINKLRDQLETEDIVFNEQVTNIEVKKDGVIVTANNNYNCERVVLALPPKLWANNISFTPSLSKELIQIATQTHTWMEDSIKVALTYETPFWNKEQLPSTLFCNEGPITEFYDHTNHENTNFALCGFISPTFKNLSDTDRKEQVVNQVTKVFGAHAKEFTSYHEYLWGKDQNTHIESDGYIVPHQNNGNPIFNKSIGNDRLLISNTETASQFPGYMEGAVQAASNIAKKIIEQKH